MAALEEAFGDVIQRQITDDASFDKWKASAARREIVAFVTRLNNSCVNKPNLSIDAAPPQARKLMDPVPAKKEEQIAERLEDWEENVTC